jgi:hypothetical protein
VGSEWVGAEEEIGVEVYSDCFLSLGLDVCSGYPCAHIVHDDRARSAIDKNTIFFNKQGQFPVDRRIVTSSWMLDLEVRHEGRRTRNASPEMQPHTRGSARPTGRLLQYHHFGGAVLARPDFGCCLLFSRLDGDENPGCG